MSDERITRLLRALDRPVEPDPGFSDSLYATLADEIALGRPRFGERRPFALPMARGIGLVWALLLVALLGGLLAGLVVVGGGGRSAEAIVGRSQTVFVAPPPFSMTSRLAGGGEATYRFDGTTMRFDVTAGPFGGELPEGYYVVANSQQQAVYDPETNTWSTSDNPMGFALLQLAPSWLATVPWVPGAEPPLVRCGEWQLVGQAEVAGRVADEVRCGEDRYWVDRESGLLVKVLTEVDDPFISAEVVGLEVEPTLDPALFAFEPPPGAFTEEEPVPTRPRAEELTPGQPAPTWTGRLLDGTPFSTDQLAGRPSALFIWCACNWGPEAQHFVAEARARAGEMNLILVGSDREGMVRGLAGWLAVETPIVGDYSGDLLTAWGVWDLAALVMLHADGTVADVHPPHFGAEKLAAVLDALAAGDPIPEPDAPPEPVLDEHGDLPVSTILEVGQPAPILAGPLLGGGDLSTDSLLGKRTVVAFFEPPDPITGPQTDAQPPDLLLADVESRGGAVNLVLVAHGEPSPGATQAYVDAREAEAPVLFDWDGSLLDRWGLHYLPSLVLLEADGSVAGYYGGLNALSSPRQVIDAWLAGEPVPAQE